MRVLGIRCSNTDYSYVVIIGTKDSPLIEKSDSVTFPKGYGRGESLKWFFQEIDAIFNEVKIDRIAIKGAEFPAKKGNAFIERIENESIVFFVGANHGVIESSRKVKSTIAKDLGLKGKGKYLQTKLDTSVIESYNSYESKLQEAILVAWSSL